MPTADSDGVRGAPHTATHIRSMRALRHILRMCVCSEWLASVLCCIFTALTIRSTSPFAHVTIYQIVGTDDSNVFDK